MKTLYQIKIKIVLLISSLIFVLFVFNSGVFARGYVTPPKVDSSFLKSSKWPQALQDFVRLELIYGDHQIDKLEACTPTHCQDRK